MAVTSHGHQIPNTPALASDTHAPKHQCGGIRHCLTCKTEQIDAMEQPYTVPCKMDYSLKHVDNRDGTTSTGEIAWCDVHQDRFVIHARGEEMCGVRASSLNIVELTAKVESVGDILRSISENFNELADSFKKLAEALERQED